MTEVTDSNPRAKKYARRQADRVDRIVGQGQLTRDEASRLARGHFPRTETAAARRARETGALLQARAQF